MGTRPWIADATFLARLEPAERQELLRHAIERRLVPQDGQPPVQLAEPGRRGAVLLLSGQAVLLDDEGGNPERVSSGRLVGAGWMSGRRQQPPDLRAAAPVSFLFFPAELMDRLSPELRASVRELLAELDELDYTVLELEHRLRHEPTLRRLRAQQRVQVLQASRIEDLGPRDVLVEKGRVATRLPLLLSGSAHANVGKTGTLPLPNGTLVGVHSDWLGRQPRQPYRIVTDGKARVLWIPIPALARVAQSNVWFQRAAAGGHGSPRGTCYLIHAARPRQGATTVAFATAIQLALDAHNRTQQVAILDFDGAATCAQMGRSAERTGRFGPPCEQADLGVGRDTVHVWPCEGSDAAVVLEAMLVEYEEVLITHATGTAPPQRVLDQVQTAVLVSTVGDECTALPLGDHQRRIHAIRQPQQPYPAVASTHRYRPGLRPPSIDAPLVAFVRLPWDPACSACMHGEAPLSRFADPASATGRAAARLGRMLQGRSVGVALSGGGSWGFTHLGLLRALHEAQLPVDFVSGTSIGSVVGAIYCGGPQTEALERLDRLEAARLELQRSARVGVLSTAFVGRFIESQVGIQHVLQPEVPLVAVSADVLTSRRYVPWKSSLADAVRAASSFPGMYRPFTEEGRRLVDGGVVENLPAMVVGRTGADFVLASNCIPVRSQVGDTPSRLRKLHLGRVVDTVSSLFILMGQAARQDAGVADYAFTPVGHQICSPLAFGDADRIAAMSLEQAREQLPAIRAAYEADLTTHRPAG